MAGLSETFAAFAEELEAAQEIREQVRTAARPLDVAQRRLAAVAQGMHSATFLKERLAFATAGEGEGQDDPVARLFDVSVEPVLREVQSAVEALRECVPPGEESKFSGSWSNSLQSLSSSLVFLHFIRRGELLSKPDLQTALGLRSGDQKEDHKASIVLEVSDYLMSVASAPSELARLCVNAVTCGDLSLPLQISSFVNDIFAAFRVLNLKNDGLRRKYDSIKYDVKRIEEVVYDLSLRGMLPSE
jgi:predicted translin family RNA/ssDNA-binding protein